MSYPKRVTRCVSYSAEIHDYFMFIETVKQYTCEMVLNVHCEMADEKANKLCLNELFKYSSRFKRFE